VILRLAAKLDNIFVGNLCEPAPGDYPLSRRICINHYGIIIDYVDVQLLH